MFDIPRDLSWRGYRTGGLAERADPALVAAIEPIIRGHAKRYGWSKDVAWKVRTGVRILLGFLDGPGVVITASDATVLAGTDMPMNRSLEVLAEAGMVEEDRIPTIEAWYARQTTGLPEPMVTELHRWFDVMLHGSRTPPRMPHNQITIRLQLGWALPTLRAWAADGKCSLREITRSDVRAILPPSGNPRSTLGQGLRSIFTVLRAKRVIFTNPAARINIGFHQPRQPLPLDTRLLRAALTSPDPARATIVALVAFHGLRAGQIRNLQLTDGRDGRLHTGGRVILLADPVRARLAAWLDYRARQWPHTANPHLFLSMLSALGIRPVGPRWVKLKAGVPGGIQAIREGRILHEAHASGRDIRLICDLFGLSVTAAERYTATIDRHLTCDATPAGFARQSGPART